MVTKWEINGKFRFSFAVPGLLIGLVMPMSCVSDPPKNDGGSSQSTCSNDSDCTQCLYFTAPTDSGQCEIDASISCCSGPVLSKLQCDANQSAWNSNCSNKPSCSQTPCPVTTCGVACRNGICVRSC